MMATMNERGCSTSTASSARERLPSDLFHQLERIFDAEKLDYIASVLTAGELRVVGNLYDAYIIAQIKEMT